MQLDNLRSDDGAVSPVIGVILMVAITVILAAVIATFVLGLGDQVGQTAPQASFSFDYDQGNSELDVAHAGGDPVQANELFIRSPDSIGTTGDWTEDFESGGNLASTDEVTAGNSITIDSVNPGYTVRVVYEAQAAGNSATLGEWVGPDA